MQFNEEDGEDTSFPQRAGNGRGREQHLKKAPTSQPAKPQVGGAAAAAASKAGPSGSAFGQRSASQRNDQRVTDPWAKINDPGDDWPED